MPLARFSAPGNLSDFESDDQANAWSKNLSDLVESTIAAVTACVPLDKLRTTPLNSTTLAREAAS